MKSGDHRRPRIPHFAKELMPERCAVEDEHLPKKHAPRPDGHRERRENFPCGFPLDVLLLQTVERKRGDPWREHEDESDVPKERVTAAKHEGVPFMEGENEEHGHNRHEAREEPEERTGEREEQEEIEGEDRLWVSNEGKEGEAQITAKDEMFKMGREEAQVTVIEGDIAPLEEEEEEGRPCPCDTHEAKTCGRDTAEEEGEDAHLDRGRRRTDDGDPIDAFPCWGP